MDFFARWVYKDLPYSTQYSLLRNNQGSFKYTFNLQTQKLCHVTLKLKFWAQFHYKPFRLKISWFYCNNRALVLSCLIVSKLKQYVSVVAQTHWPWSHLCGSTLPHSQPKLETRLNRVLVVTVNWHWLQYFFSKVDDEKDPNILAKTTLSRCNRCSCFLRNEV